MSDRELSRFLATIRGPRRMSQGAVEATARDLAAELAASREDRELITRVLVRGAWGEPGGPLPGVRLTVEDADRLAQERPPYPPRSNVPAEQCTGRTGWHRPQVENWNRGDRESTCTWCGAAIERKFMDPIWRTGQAEREGRPS